MLRVMTSDELWTTVAGAILACRYAECPESDEELRAQFLRLFLENIPHIGTC